jgi:hypothetical protein
MPRWLWSARAMATSRTTSRADEYRYAPAGMAICQPCLGNPIEQQHAFVRAGRNLAESSPDQFILRFAGEQAKGQVDVADGV